jgi:methylmalonyl-CoA/ethylmalonyl-CoA epimerase
MSSTANQAPGADGERGAAPPGTAATGGASTGATGPATPGLSRIGQVAVNVHDLERAIGFYRDVLGLPFLFRASQLAFFDCAGLRLMLSTPERPALDHPASVLYFDVADLHGSYDALRRRGASFVAPPHLIARMPDHELWMAFFVDTEGNTLALMSEVREHGVAR